MTSRSPARRIAWSDYRDGRAIDHVDGMTVEEAEHQIATRLYQNTAKVHFNQFSEGTGPLRPSADLWRPCHLARARAVASTASPMRSTSPRSTAGGTSRRCSRAIRCSPGAKSWTTAPIAGRDDVGALRLRMVAAKNHPCADFPLREGETSHPHVVLDLDYWALAPRRA